MKVLAAIVVVVASFCVAQEPCNLYCGGQGPRLFPDNGGVNTMQGRPGKQGPAGPPGRAIQCECPALDRALRKQFQELTEKLELLENRSPKPSSSCKEVKRNCSTCDNGIYTLQDSYGNQYKTYCDMTIDGGGWTLVASVHDNNLGPSGRCTVGDRWSSEQGRSTHRPSGDGNWENRNIFGQVITATDDDFKNAAYFELEARDIIIWHVPNETPLQNFSISAYLKYRTSDGFLSNYGGNLFHLYSEHFPIKYGLHSSPTDSGPAIPVVFDRGDAQSLLSHLPPNAKPNVDPGFIQFRATGPGKGAYALCPGVRNKPTVRYPSYSCLGSTGQTEHPHYCGDLSSFFYEGSAVGTGWSADQTLITTTFLIFYR